MDLSKITIGKKFPEAINVIIEIPKDSQNKYEFDKKSGAIILNRVLYSPMHYPTDYGFIPHTYCDDGDPLDVLVLGSDPLFPGCVVEARPIGLLKMIDGNEADYKILAVQTKNPRFENIKDISDIKSVHEHSLKEISHFFSAYKELEGKKVKIQNWEGAKEAKKEIIKAQKAYKKI